jgi:hypothetical protein
LANDERRLALAAGLQGLGELWAIVAFTAVHFGELADDLPFAAVEIGQRRPNG